MHDPYQEKLDRYGKLVNPIVERHISYEGLAANFATSAIRAASFLNGGGLIAIPAAVALFRIDPLAVAHTLIYSAFFLSGVCLLPRFPTFLVFTQWPGALKRTCNQPLLTRTSLA